MFIFFVKIQPECVLFLYVLYKPKRLWQDICYNLIKHGAETIYIYIIYLKLNFGLNKYELIRLLHSMLYHWIGNVRWNTSDVYTTMFYIESEYQILETFLYKSI